MDKLKQYLQENSSGLDRDEPGEEVWDRILEKSAPAPAPVRRLQKRWYVAAAAAVLVFVAGWQWTKFSADAGTATMPLSWSRHVLSAPPAPVITDARPVAAVKNEHAVAKVSAPDMTTVLGSFSSNYSKLVKLQERAIRRTPVMAETPDYFKDFRTMLQQMDNEEILIRKELKKNSKDAILLEQLISLYQQKLEVLKALQTEIGKLNGRTREERQHTGSTGSYYLNI